MKREPYDTELSWQRGIHTCDQTGLYPDNTSVKYDALYEVVNYFQFHLSIQNRK